MAQLLYLEAQDPDKDIQLYINSPGGSVTDGMAIYDTMQYVKCDVSTICVGMAASHGRVPALLRREGQADRAAQRRDHDPPALRRYPGPGRPIWRSTPSVFSSIKEQLNRILAENTGKTLEHDQSRLPSATTLCLPEEAMEYGLIDKVIYKR